MYHCYFNFYGIELSIRTQTRKELSSIRKLYQPFLISKQSLTNQNTPDIGYDNLDIVSSLSQKDLFAFHAAGYENGKGKGILLPGKGASGKTTIAYSALLSKYPFVGDDVILCRQNENNLQMLPLKSHLLLKKANKIQTYFVLDNYPKDVFGMPDIELIVFPQITDNRSTRLLKQKDQKERFRRLLSSIIWIKEPKIQQKQIAMIKYLCSLVTYELLLGQDHRKSPEIAIKLLDTI